MPTSAPPNDEVAATLERVADLLEAQDENPYRVRAWRAGARSVRASHREVAAILDEAGLAGLDRLPGIGKSLAAAIAELVHTGRLRLLDRLEGEVSPEEILQEGQPIRVRVIQDDGARQRLGLSLLQSDLSLPVDGEAESRH